MSGQPTSPDERRAALERELQERLSPAQFVEALGVEPDRPARFAGIEEAPMRFDVIDPDPDLVRARIEAA